MIAMLRIIYSKRIRLYYIFTIKYQKVVRYCVVLRMQFVRSIANAFVCVRVSKPNTCPCRTDANACFWLVIRLFVCIFLYICSLAIVVIDRLAVDIFNEKNRLDLYNRLATNERRLFFHCGWTFSRFSVHWRVNVTTDDRRSRHVQRPESRILFHWVCSFQCQFPKIFIPIADPSLSFILFRINPDTLTYVACYGPALALLSSICKKKEYVM